MKLFTDFWSSKGVLGEKSLNIEGASSFSRTKKPKKGLELRLKIRMFTKFIFGSVYIL